MAKTTTLGISIQRSPFSETSQIVHFLTRDLGRVVCMAKGAFRAKNNFEGGIDLMELSRITVTRRRDGPVALLNQRKLLKHYPRLRGTMEGFASAALLSELLRWSVQECQRIPGLFDLTAATLDALEEGEAGRPAVLFVFQGALLKMLGYTPILDRCVECNKRPEPGNILTAYPGRGGVVCRRCHGLEKDRVSISWAASRLILECTAARPAPDAADPLPDKLIKEVWSFFELFFQYFLEKRIYSFALVKDLERRALSS